MKKIQKILSVLFACVFLLCGIFAVLKVAPPVLRGCEMYREALQEKPLSVRIAEIRAREDYTCLSDISDEYVERVVASEDHRFYYHFGVDPVAIMRAVVHNLRAGHLVEGGSTITQQLAKNMFFSEERTCSRKIAEVLAAFALERALTKDQILELYCNITYFGSGCYGIAAAADYYYGVAPAALDAAEAAALVHTLPAPNVLNPLLAA